MHAHSTHDARWRRTTLLLHSLSLLLRLLLLHLLLLCLQACADKLDRELKLYGCPPKFPSDEDDEPAEVGGSGGCGACSGCSCSRTVQQQQQQQQHADCCV